nr:heme ABC transporter substrate-binding protein IsdE [Geomicrobium sp. JCM 19039]
MKTVLLIGCLIPPLILAACQPISENVVSNLSTNAGDEDEIGEEVSLTAEEIPEVATEEEIEPERIVSTTVAATEIADALNLDLLGIPTSYKELPERYEGVTEIGNPMGPDMEQIRQLNPEEVWSVTTLFDDLEEPFEQAQLDARFLDFQSVDAMIEEIKTLGRDFDRETEAATLVETFDEAVRENADRTSGLAPPSVLILMGVPGSYLVATEESYIGDLVRLAGGENVIESEEGVEYLASNTEHLHQANPDVILRAAHGMPEEVVEMFDEEFQTNDIWQHFTAVQGDRVYDLEELLFGTTGSIAVPEALEELEPMLYPELETVQ